MTDVARDKRRYGVAITILTAAIICGITVVVCFTIYRYDNKYTASGPSAANGVLTLTEQTLEEFPVIFLINGWEYFGGKIMTPEDFYDNPPTPDQYIFIGRYGGFEAGAEDGSPHGSASYRLIIVIPEDIRFYAIEFPEIFSAYKLYINGKPSASMGDPGPGGYQPATGIQSVSVEAGGSIEILLAVSDYSHFYSGMVYPPVFGQPKAVAALANGRLILRSVICAMALLIGLLSALIGLYSRENTEAILYGALCVFFVGYACYPITRTFLTGFQFMYAVERFSYNALLVVVTLLAYKVCALKYKWSGIFFLFGIFMCLASVILPFIIPLGNLRLLMFYSTLMDIYEWTTAAFITATAALSMLKGAARSKELLYGFLVFDVALIMDRLLHLYEPIVTGWFIELACFATTMFIGAAIGKEVAARYLSAAILGERAVNIEKLYQAQQGYFTALRQEMEETKKMRHDMRHHFTVIDGYVKNRQYDKLSEYTAVYGAETALSAKATFGATTFGVSTAGNEGNDRQNEYCPIDVINVLSNHYSAIAGQNNILFDVRCDLNAAGSDQSRVGMSDSDLCCLYANLMENAVEACLRMKTGARFIRVAVARPSPDSLIIRVWNSADSGARAAGDRFLSSKDAERGGYGLYSIKSIAEKYKGVASFQWNKGEQIFESIVTVIA